MSVSSLVQNFSTLQTSLYRPVSIVWNLVAEIIFCKQTNCVNMSAQQGGNKAKKDEVFDLEQQFILRMPPVTTIVVFHHKNINLIRLI